MKSNKLMQNLAKLGLPLFEPTSDSVDVEETVAEVVNSRDTRLWELFPVLLANISDEHPFVPQRVHDLLPDEKKRADLNRLFLLSLSLYSLHHLSFNWSAKLKARLTPEEKAQVKEWRDALAHDRIISWNGCQLAAERLKKSFQLYIEQSVDKGRRRKERHAEYSLSYALSQIFSPKQADLFKRKLEGLPLTKTEQEYYSRTVKKKVVALANSELHSLARKLLER